MLVGMDDLSVRLFALDVMSAIVNGTPRPRSRPWGIAGRASVQRIAKRTDNYYREGNPGSATLFEHIMISALDAIWVEHADLDYLPDLPDGPRWDNGIVRMRCWRDWPRRRRDTMTAWNVDHEDDDGRKNAGGGLFKRSEKVDTGPRLVGWSQHVDIITPGDVMVISNPLVPGADSAMPSSYQALTGATLYRYEDVQDSHYAYSHSRRDRIDYKWDVFAVAMVAPMLDRLNGWRSDNTSFADPAMIVSSDNGVPATTMDMLPIDARKTGYANELTTAADRLANHCRETREALGRVHTMPDALRDTVERALDGADDLAVQLNVMRGRLDDSGADDSAVSAAALHILRSVDGRTVDVTRMAGLVDEWANLERALNVDMRTAIDDLSATVDNMEKRL